MAAIFFALLINEIANQRFKGIVRTITYMPHFVSWVVFGGIVMTLLSGDGGVIAYFILFNAMHIYNTFWVYIIPSMLNLFFIIVGINFFGSIPTALIESAKLDGASELKVLMRIVMPVSTPFIATLALFSAVNQWNSWLDSASYVNSEDLRTVAYRMLVEINQSTGTTVTGGTITTKATSLTTQATAMVTSMLPIMCVYPFLQL